MLIPRTRKPTISLIVGYQLDDEPNLYMGNGWKSPNIFNWGSRYNLTVTQLHPQKLPACANEHTDAL